MSSYNVGLLTKGLRKRTGLTQGELLNEGGVTETSTISRNETGLNKPRKKTFYACMKAMNISVPAFLELRVTGILHDAFMLRESSMSLLTGFKPSQIYVDEATRLIEELKKFKSTIEMEDVCKQFISLCQARLYFLQGAAPDKAFDDIINEGITQTYPDYNFAAHDGQMLLLQEVQLLHMQAVAFAIRGETETAANLLQNVCNGLDELPCDRLTKERQMLPMLLDLTILFVRQGKINEAKETIEKGLSMSFNSGREKYLAGFGYYKAQLLLQEGDRDEAICLLKQVYYAYSCLMLYDLADEVKMFAEMNNIKIMNDITIPDRKEPPTPLPRTAPAIKCKSIAEMLLILCGEEGINRKKICECMMSSSNINRIQDGEADFNFRCLEGMMQRLGRDTNRYGDAFLSENDFDDEQVCSDITTILENMRHDEAENLIVGLNRKTKIRRQFALASEAEIYYNRHGYDSKHMEMLTAAIQVTRKEFSLESINESNGFTKTAFLLEDVHGMRLTLQEISLFNRLALNLVSNGNHVKGVILLDGLLKGMNKHFEDKSLKMPLYAKVLHNCAQVESEHFKIETALERCDEGEYLCAKHGDLRNAAGFAFVKARCLFKSGKKAESLKYADMAFYCTKLLRRSTENILRLPERTQ